MLKRSSRNTMTRLTRTQRKVRDAAFADWLDSLRPGYDVRKAMVSARQRSGFTQRELALRMGTSQAVIGRLERGERSPNVKTLRKMAEVTGSKLVIRLDEPEGVEAPGLS
jgi:ribosome-binding protein aMBF1 (putative translation factor)